MKTTKYKIGKIAKLSGLFFGIIMLAGGCSKELLDEFDVITKPTVDGSVELTFELTVSNNYSEIAKLTAIGKNAKDVYFDNYRKNDYVTTSSFYHSLGTDPAPTFSFTQISTNPYKYILNLRTKGTNYTDDNKFEILADYGLFGGINVLKKIKVPAGKYVRKIDFDQLAVYNSECKLGYSNIDIYRSDIKPNEKLNNIELDSTISLSPLNDGTILVSTDFSRNNEPCIKKFLHANNTEILTDGFTLDDSEMEESILWGNIYGLADFRAKHSYSFSNFGSIKTIDKGTIKVPMILSHVPKDKEVSVLIYQFASQNEDSVLNLYKDYDTNYVALLKNQQNFYPLSRKSAKLIKRIDTLFTADYALIPVPTGLNGQTEEFIHTQIIVIDKAKDAKTVAAECSNKNYRYRNSQIIKGTNVFDVGQEITIDYYNYKTQLVTTEDIILDGNDKHLVGQVNGSYQYRFKAELFNYVTGLCEYKTSNFYYKTPECTLDDITQQVNSFIGSQYRESSSQLPKYDLKGQANCEGANLKPSFTVYFRKTNSTSSACKLGEVVEGSLQTKKLKPGQEYEFFTVVGGKKYEKVVKIPTDKFEQDLFTIELDKETCDNIKKFAIKK